MYVSIASVVATGFECVCQPECGGKGRIGQLFSTWDWIHFVGIDKCDRGNQKLPGEDVQSKIYQVPIS